MPAEENWVPPVAPFWDFDFSGSSSNTDDTSSVSSAMSSTRSIFGIDSETEDDYDMDILARGLHFFRFEEPIYPDSEISDHLERDVESNSASDSAPSIESELESDVSSETSEEKSLPESIDSELSSNAPSDPYEREPISDEYEVPIVVENLPDPGNMTRHQYQELMETLAYHGEWDVYLTIQTSELYDHLRE